MGSKWWVGRVWNDSPFVCRNSCTHKAKWAGARHRLGNNLMHVQNVFHNTLNCCKWSSQHASNFKYSDFSAFEDKFLHSIHNFTHFTAVGHPKLTAFSAQFTPLTMHNHLEFCVLSNAWSPKATFNILKAHIAFFFPLKIKSDADTFFFQFCHFLGYQNHKLSNTILHTTRHYSSIPCAATPNSKQSVTQQTLPYWHLVVAICASSSSSVTLQAVQQTFCHTMCHYQNALGKGHVIKCWKTREKVTLWTGYLILG